MERSIGRRRGLLSVHPVPVFSAQAIKPNAAGVEIAHGCSKGRIRDLRQYNRNQRSIFELLATLSNGDFVVVWTDESGNFGEEFSGVVGKIFDADGNVLVDEFHVNTTTAIEQFEPSVAALSGGGFVVGWTN